MSSRNAVTPHSVGSVHISSMENMAASILDALKSSPVDVDMRDDDSVSDYEDEVELRDMAPVDAAYCKDEPPTLHQQKHVLQEATLDDCVVSKRPMLVGRKGGFSKLASIKGMKTKEIHRDALVIFCSSIGIYFPTSKYISKAAVCETILARISVEKAARKRSVVTSEHRRTKKQKSRVDRFDSVELVPRDFLPMEEDNSDDLTPRTLNFSELIGAVNNVIQIAQPHGLTDAIAPEASSTRGVSTSSTRRMILSTVASLAENAKVVLQSSKTQEEILKARLSQSTLQLYTETGDRILALESKIAGQGNVATANQKEDLQVLKAHKQRVKATLLP